MKIEDMIIGVLYKVTKQSDDETFIVNDIIERNSDNDILCQYHQKGNIGGWVDHTCSEKALEGCELEACKDYAIRRINKLQEEIEQLKKDYEL